MTRRRLLAEVDSLELAEWQAYERVAGPFGGARGDAQAGVVASTVANVNRDPKENPEPFTADEFMPDWDQEVSDG